MRPEAVQAGIGMPIRGLLHTLAGIQETVLICPPPAIRRQGRRLLTDPPPHPAAAI